MEVADILDDAADIIERDGWCQGTVGKDEGRKCLVGSLKSAVGIPVKEPFIWYRSTTTMEQYNKAEDKISDLIGTDTILPFWNDAEGRTEQEVLDVLRKAAKNARS